MINKQNNKQTINIEAGNVAEASAAHKVLRFPTHCGMFNVPNLNAEEAAAFFCCCNLKQRVLPDAALYADAARG